MNAADLIEDANEIQAKHNYYRENYGETGPYNMRFPIGVFGTLRTIPVNQGNARLMYARKPVYHGKAFLPHTVCDGIQIKFSKNSSAIFEIFQYDPTDWFKVIRGIDALEGFVIHDRTPSPYIRTLMELHLLPHNFAEEEYSKGILVNDRDLKIPIQEWNKYPTCFAWVYSNFTTNRSLQDVSENPVKWWA